MGLQNQGYAFHGCCVSAFASFGEPLLDQLLRVSKLADLFARRAFAAKIVRQPLTIGGLSKHPGERELADAARACK